MLTRIKNTTSLKTPKLVSEVAQRAGFIKLLLGIGSNTKHWLRQLTGLIPDILTSARDEGVCRGRGGRFMGSPTVFLLKIWLKNVS